MQLEEAIKKRKSVKIYSSKKPDWRKIIKALDATRYAPRAGNISRTKFILVQRVDTIKKINSFCQQECVGQAQTLVVVITEDSDYMKFYHDNGLKIARQQCGALIQNFLLELTAQGLVTNWVSIFDEAQIKNLLKIPEKFTLEAIFPIGIESKQKTAEKAKPELEGMVYFDEFDCHHMKPSPRVGLEGL
ncbi:MAG: nitroreductase family protein [Nanoarchaeota archaeon]